MNAPTVAVFVTGHGFGHAARAAAVIDALRRAVDGVRIHLITDVPEWFFPSGLVDHYHGAVVDPGLVQASAVTEDLSASLARLNAFYPMPDPLIEQWADWVFDHDVTLIVSDIAPLGIAAAKRARVPVVLIENFTWDQILRPLADTDARFEALADDVAGWYEQVDYHVLARPFLGETRGDLQVHPVARSPRRPRTAVRTDLGLDDGPPLVLVALGGTPWRPDRLDRLISRSDCHFVLAADVTQERRDQNVTLLPPCSRFYLPDLVHAADAVVGKAGYSTVSEAFHAGVGYGFVPRAGFAEAAALEAFLVDEMRAVRLSPEGFAHGEWVDRIPELLARRMPRVTPNGADEVARFLAGLLGR